MLPLFSYHAMRLLVLILLLFACQLVASPAATGVVVPPGWPQPLLAADNPPTPAGVELGRLLFDDRRLSVRHAQSCVACHREDLAFSNGGAFGTGADRVQGVRSPPPIFNQAWIPAFGWDGAHSRLRDQAIAAIINPIEMNADPAVIEADLNRDEAMRARFAAAFGTPEVTLERVGRALEQFMLTITAHDSRHDRAERGEVVLTPEEQRGKTLFFTEHAPQRGLNGAGCFQCHPAPLFTDYAYRNNGLDRTFMDLGRGEITGKTEDHGRFKTPSLRNIALTAPYMHNGRFGDLLRVIEHYAGSVDPSPTLDPILAAQPPGGIALNDDDRNALVAFLRTLTDERLRTGGR